MSSVWTDEEVGPACFCDSFLPTMIKRIDDEFYLVCLGHTYGSASTFTIPQERPENFSKMNGDQFMEYCDNYWKDNKTTGSV